MKNEKTGQGEFRQQVRMAAVQVAGLRPDELAQALAYEMEPLSGIPAPEAEVAYQPVIDPDPTVRVYDVVVRRRTRQKGAAGKLERWLRPACVFAVLVALGMAGDGIWLTVRQSSLGRKVNERHPLQAELDRIESATKAAHAAVEASRSHREAVVRAQDEAAERRSAHADLLTELATACGEGAVLKSIETAEDAQTIRIRAIDVSSEAAAKMMQTLSTSVARKGWQLVPGEIVSGAGATAAFSFEIKRTR